jgi:peptidyl-prolyl cis-trans isomerase B (cyclophilin B)
MKLILNLTAVLGLALLTGCNASSEKPASPATTPTTEAAKPATAAAATTNTVPATKEVAVLTTSEGVMVAEFWPEVAPETVANFKKLAGQKFYDGTAFHRIIKGFMIQGGDPLTKDPSKSHLYGSGDPGYSIKAEFNDRKHERGVLSMARSDDPNSAGSQFFICLAPVSQLDHQYTTFGRLISGDDVLEKLGNSPVGPGARGEMSRPLSRVGLISVSIVTTNLPASK